MELTIKTAYGNCLELDCSLKLTAFYGFPVLFFSNQKEQYYIEYDFSCNKVSFKCRGENIEVCEYWNEEKIKHLEETFKIQYADYYKAYYDGFDFMPFYNRDFHDNFDIDYEPVIKTILTEMDICCVYASVCRC